MLLIGDSFTGFGSEIYANNLINLFQKNGWETLYIAFDGDASNDKYKLIKLNSIERLFGRFIYLTTINKKIKSSIIGYNPDLILLNNVHLTPLSILPITKGVTTFNIIHDCRRICNIGKCIKPNLDICKGYLFSNCIKCCSSEFSKIHILAKCYVQRKENKAFNKYNISNIFPSEWLRKFSKPYGIDGYTINNYIKHEDFIFHPVNCRKKYAYIGGITLYKGAKLLLETFDEFSCNKDVELYLAGPINDDIKEVLDRLNNNKINYVGIINHNDINNFLFDKYCLIVPSLIMDNYPTTVLEGQISGKLIIGSNRGGIPEIVGDNGLIFDPLDKEGLLKALLLSQTLDEQKKNMYVINAYKNIKEKTEANYYSKLIECVRNKKI